MSGGAALTGRGGRTGSEVKPAKAAIHIASSNAVRAFEEAAVIQIQRKARGECTGYRGECAVRGVVFPALG